MFRAYHLPYPNRSVAGRTLAGQLMAYADRTDALVLALPRGGAPVAAEVARLLRLPWDVFLVRKLGVPGYEELAMGAIASGGVRVLNEEIVHHLGLPETAITRAISRAAEVLHEREVAYRGDRPALDARDRIVILVDDGLTTGATVRAAVRALRAQGAKRLVVAVPVAAPEVCEALRPDVDEVVCAATPDPFEAAGPWYEDFSQASDDEIRTLLEEKR